MNDKDHFHTKCSLTLEKIAIRSPSLITIVLALVNTSTNTPQVNLQIILTAAVLTKNALITHLACTLLRDKKIRISKQDPER
jgi:hypothetical protein